MTLPSLLARLDDLATLPGFPANLYLGDAGALAFVLPDRAVDALNPDDVDSPDPARGRVAMKWHRVQPDGRGESVLDFLTAGYGSFSVAIRCDRPDGWSPAIVVPWQAGVGPGRVVLGRPDTQETVDGLFAAYFSDPA